MVGGEVEEVLELGAGRHQVALGQADLAEEKVDEGKLGLELVGAPQVRFGLGGSVFEEQGLGQLEVRLPTLGLELDATLEQRLGLRGLALTVVERAQGGVAGRELVVDLETPLQGLLRLRPL